LKICSYNFLWEEKNDGGKRDNIMDDNKTFGITEMSKGRFEA
jgi:hypothetical protein